MRREGCDAAGGEGVEGWLEAKSWRGLSDDRLQREGDRRGGAGAGAARLRLRSTLSSLQSAAATDTASGEREAGDGRNGKYPQAQVPTRSQPRSVSPSPSAPAFPSSSSWSSPSRSSSSGSPPVSALPLHRGYRRRRRRRPFAAVGIATAAVPPAVAVAAATPAAAAGAEGSSASATVPSPAAAVNAAAAAAAAATGGEKSNTGPRRGLKQRVVASASSTADRGGAVPKKVPFWRRLRRRTTRASTTTTTTTAADAEAAAGAAMTADAPKTGLVEFVRSFSSGTRRRGLVEDVLKVLVWSFFAERLVQSALVGWGHSGRVGPVEQLGGTLIEADPSDARYVETRAVLRGVRMGRDTLHLNTARASPEMFTKVDISEIRFPSSRTTRGEISRRQSEQGDDDDDDGAEALLEQGCEDANAEDEDEDCPLLFQEYAAPAFAHMRGLYGMSSSEYRRSFRESSRMIAHASNSKSAQSFMFSEDGKYMLKTASESELDSMLRLLPRYAEHVARRRGSLIARFYGIYRVTDPITSRSTVFISSSNVFSTEKRLHKRYDLKGSVVGRRTISPKSGAVAKPTTMLKDLDLADGEKIQLAAGCKKRLLAELSADAEFLAGLGVMDYSLLVGIHRPHRPKSSKVLAFPLAVLSVASKPIWSAGCFMLGFLPGGARRGGRRPQVGVYPGREPGVVYYMGIIDVLQRYNLKKILERGAKGVMYNRHEISAVPPEEYRDRFLDFIDSRTE